MCRRHRSEAAVESEVNVWFKCSRCGNIHEVRSQSVGKKILCMSSGKFVRVPKDAEQVKKEPVVSDTFAFSSKLLTPRRAVSESGHSPKLPMHRPYYGLTRAG
jgi:hypothetical protein